MTTLLLFSIGALAVGLTLKVRKNRAIAKARKHHKRLPR
jgi:hypothetical protein